MCVYLSIILPICVPIPQRIYSVKKCGSILLLALLFQLRDLKQVSLGFSLLIKGSNRVTEAHTESERGACTKLSEEVGDSILALAPMGYVTLDKSLPFSGLPLLLCHL